MIIRRIAVPVSIALALELAWMLRGSYKRSLQAVIQGFKVLLAIEHLQLEQGGEQGGEQVCGALELHRSGPNFAEALSLLRSESCADLVRFSRTLALLGGTQQVRRSFREPHD